MLLELETYIIDEKKYYNNNYLIFISLNLFLNLQYKVLFFSLFPLSALKVDDIINGSDFEKRFNKALEYIKNKYSQKNDFNFKIAKQIGIFSGLSLGSKQQESL